MALPRLSEGLRLSKPLVFTALTLVLLLFFGGLWKSQRVPFAPQRQPVQTASSSHPCAVIEELRKHIKLPQTISYARRTIRTRVTKDPISRKSLVQQREKLFPRFTSLDCSAATPEDLHLDESGNEIALDYRPEEPYHADTSSILVGAATSLDRLEHALPHFKRWLSNTKTSLVVNVADSDDNSREMDRVQDLMTAANIDAILLPNIDKPQPGDEPERHGHRHFSIVKQLQSQRKAHHKWFAVIDDDTFFLSLEAVVAALQQYDSDKPYYIGALTEDFHALSAKYGYMAYGGAGMFLSGPLLDTLLENFDDCLPKQKGDIQGDMVFRDCIYEYTSPPVQLTVLPGLHQADFRGDASGWYEAGLDPILTLHHWSSQWWHLYPVHHGHLVSNICDNSCFLQRYRFADDVVLTNGYSVVQYPDGADNVDLDRVEATFMHDEEDHMQWEYSLGKLRPRMGVEEKISWRLEYATEDEDGTVRQFYLRRAGDEAFDSGRLKQKVEGILELEWKR